MRTLNNKKPTKIQKIIQIYKLNAVKHIFYSKIIIFGSLIESFRTFFKYILLSDFFRKKDKKYIYYVYIVYVYKIEIKAVILRLSYGYVAVILR